MSSDFILMLFFIMHDQLAYGGLVSLLNLQTLQIKEDVKAVACRATWRVDLHDLQMANNLICSKRLHLDDALSQLNGVQFYFSCITAVSSNAKASQASGAPTTITYPGVAYFVAYRQTDDCDDNQIFTLLHNMETEPAVQPIHTRGRADGDGRMDAACRELFQVVKDHNSDLVMNMVNASNHYCLATCSRTMSADESDGSVHENRQPRYPSCPCRLVVVNAIEFDVALHDAVTKLTSDGMKITIHSALTAQINGPCLAPTTDELSATIEKIASLMRICQHALHRGDVYAKPPDATMSYVKMMDVTSYVNKLLSNESIRASVLKHFATLVRLLSHPACEIVRQIEFDLDLIEVSNGYCFQISTRGFVYQPIPLDQYGLISPRAFVPYDCGTAPRPGYFKQGIVNSFPDVAVRANFCNKFYQCLLAGKMPQKIRKLVAAGPRDSGKTSWASIFHLIIPEGKIASVTGERQFSGAMITAATQLVLIDEWSNFTLQSDLAKTILQGVGWSPR